MTFQLGASGTRSRPMVPGYSEPHEVTLVNPGDVAVEMFTFVYHV